MRVTSASSARQPEDTMSARDLPDTSSCSIDQKQPRGTVKPACTQGGYQVQLRGCSHALKQPVVEGRHRPYLHQKEGAILLGVLLEILQVLWDTPAISQITCQQARRKTEARQAEARYQGMRVDSADVPPIQGVQRVQGHATHL